MYVRRERGIGGPWTFISVPLICLFRQKPQFESCMYWLILIPSFHLNFVDGTNLIKDIKPALLLSCHPLVVLYEISK